MLKIFLFNMHSILADHIVALGFNCSSMDAFSKTLYFEEASYRGIELFNLPAFMPKASFALIISLKFWVHLLILLWLVLFFIIFFKFL